MDVGLMEWMLVKWNGCWTSRMDVAQWNGCWTSGMDVGLMEWMLD